MSTHIHTHILYNIHAHIIVNTHNTVVCVCVCVCVRDCREMCELAEQEGALIFLDDCHATGILGISGR